MKNKNAQLSIAVICLFMGILLAIQFKTTQIYETDLFPDRQDELSRKVIAITQEKEALEEEVLSLRETLNNIRQNDIAMKDLQEELQKVQISAGTIPVEGPGVIVTLNDSSVELQPGENANFSIVHDSDLLMVVNELKASGAEAIAINGERITSMSEIRCAGTLILVNSTRIGPPFVIEAIGNPDLLESGLMLNGGHLTTLKVLGLEVSIQKKENLNLKAYNGPMKVQNAVPSHYAEKAE